MKVNDLNTWILKGSNAITLGRELIQDNEIDPLLEELVFTDAENKKIEDKDSLSIVSPHHSSSDRMILISKDIVNGLVKCGRSLLIPNEYHAKINGETFELGNGMNYSINELADAFGDYPREYIDERPGEMRETLNTDNKAHEKLGWTPKVDIIEYIKENYILDK